MWLIRDHINKKGVKGMRRGEQTIYVILGDISHDFFSFTNLYQGFVLDRTNKSENLGFILHNFENHVYMLTEYIIFIYLWFFLSQKLFTLVLYNKNRQKLFLNLSAVNYFANYVKNLLIFSFNCHGNDYVTTFLSVIMSNQLLYSTRIQTEFSQKHQSDL